MKQYSLTHFFKNLNKFNFSILKPVKNFSRCKHRIQESCKLHNIKEPQMKAVKLHSKNIK